LLLDEKGIRKEANKEKSQQGKNPTRKKANKE